VEGTRRTRGHRPRRSPSFKELGLELEGEAQVEGRSVDRLIGLDGVLSDIAMMRTPDGHGRVELTKFRRPTTDSVERINAPPNHVGAYVESFFGGRHR
jgi:hypothetical protein